MKYFVSENDNLWSQTDQELIELADCELVKYDPFDVRFWRWQKESKRPVVAP